jgi:hypothetical protein
LSHDAKLDTPSGRQATEETDSGFTRKRRKGKGVQLAGTEMVIEPPRFDEYGDLQANFE